MAKAKKTKTAKTKKQPLGTRLRRWGRRLLIGAVLVPLVLLGLFAFLRPPTTPYILSEYARLGQIDREWVPLEDISPHMQWAAIAAEDVNFCRHWGLDLNAIRAALADGTGRGGSSISQQTIKNLLLWQDRSWLRKALEALLTPAMEAIWSKRRILEMYLNIIEFDEGVFGVEAAAQHYFGVPARQLSDVQAARLAMVLPAPKVRSATDPLPFERRRSRQILDGARTIAKDDRVDCLED